MNGWSPLDLLPRWVWVAWHTARHPVWYYRDWRKWRDRPAVGEKVEDCGGRVLAVVAVDGDDLRLEDGSSASWMHCCDKPPAALTGSS